MVRPGRDSLTGAVVIDENVCGPEEGKRGRRGPGVSPGAAPDLETGEGGRA